MFEVFTEKGWELRELKEITTGDIFRIRDTHLKDCRCQPGQLYVAIGPAFIDVDGDWNAPAAEYPEGANVH